MRKQTTWRGRFDSRLEAGTVRQRDGARATDDESKPERKSYWPAIMPEFPEDDERISDMDE